MDRIHILRFVIVGGSVVEIYTGGQGLILAWHNSLVNLHRTTADWFFCVFDGGGEVCVQTWLRGGPWGPMTNEIRHCCYPWKSVSLLNVDQLQQLRSEECPSVCEFKAAPLHWRTRLGRCTGRRKRHIFCPCWLIQGNAKQVAAFCVFTLIGCFDKFYFKSKGLSQEPALQLKRSPARAQSLAPFLNNLTVWIIVFGHSNGQLRDMSG